MLLLSSIEEREYVHRALLSSLRCGDCARWPYPLSSTPPIKQKSNAPPKEQTFFSLHPLRVAPLANGLPYPAGKYGPAIRRSCGGNLPPCACFHGSHHCPPCGCITPHIVIVCDYPPKRAYGPLRRRPFPCHPLPLSAGPPAGATPASIGGGKQRKGIVQGIILLFRNEKLASNFFFHGIPYLHGDEQIPQEYGRHEKAHHAIV